MTGGINMVLVEKLLQDFQGLPDDKKQQVLDFVEFLQEKQRKEIEQMMDNVIEENKEAFLELAK